jgi:hypothetical protein
MDYNMIAITVSTNYDDILKIIIPQNYTFFEKWYIITDENDKNTIKVIEDYGYDNIHIIYYDFYANNKTFNKGGAIRYCQEDIISKLNYDGNLVILDSDIFLPTNFNEIISNITIETDTLYGTNKRLDYYSYDNFKNDIIDHDYPYSKEFQGYFQLYKYDQNKLYIESYNCAGCDMSFKDNFTRKITIAELNVSHLGRSCVNWNKRNDRTDFII